MTKEYDLAILGGGTGGYVAAIRASQLGMKVALIEEKKLGGTCLHKGCIPSKSLLRTAELFRQIKNAKQFGIETADVRLQFSDAQARKNKIIDTLHNGVKALLTKAGVDIYNGFGRIMGPSIFSPIAGTISVEYKNGDENTMIVPKYVLIATGSKPKTLPGLNIDGKRILNSDQALELENLPETMIIIGGGIIGIEWASLLQDLGVQVTVIESKETILQEEDYDIRKEIQKRLEERGVRFLTNALLHTEHVKIFSDSVSITVKNREQSIPLTADQLLVSIGRSANLEEIGLTNTSIDIKNNTIITNDKYQTRESHIYAIGDCIGGMQLAHVAAAEGIVAVEHMAGVNPEPLKPTHIPACIYSYPEAARVGLTETEAKEQGYVLKIGKFPFQGIGKAHIYGDSEGFVKVIVDEMTEDLLGIHMVGPHVTDMISEAGLAKVLDATAWEVSQTIHPHPSLSEAIYESALAVDGIQIHG